MKRISQDKIEQANRFYKEGFNLQETSLLTGISYHTVRHHLKSRTFSEAQLNRYQRKPNPRIIGRILSSNGYILIYKPDYYKPMNGVYVYEHRLVWEEYHQKRLPKNWIVHHLNGIKDDNRPENLLAMPKGKHQEIIPIMAAKIRELEIENRQLKSIAPIGVN